jgi:hypothetical protein
MRLLPWYRHLLCTPNAPAAVAPAMHAECACCVRFYGSPRVSPSAQMSSESRTRRVPIFLFVFMTNRNTHPLFVQHFCHSVAKKGFCLSLALSSTRFSFTNSSPAATMFYVMLLWCA